ncbi:MAG TPA: cupin domain-containing protein [Gaiellaceae bacterium]|nr:cupin domain-containing protein [Gaiellaceae bacterium]
MTNRVFTIVPAGRRRRAVVLLGAAALSAAVIFGAAQASATPGSGVSGPIVARGFASQEVVIGVPRTVTVTKRVRFRIRGTIVSRRVSFRVATVEPLMRCGAAAPSCDIAFQQLTFQPGGHTGWHTHPGPTFVAVAQGEGTLYHGIAGCPSHRYGPNSGFFQPSAEVHNFRNEGSTPVVLHAFYALPTGTPNAAIRTDQPQPAACPHIP